MVITAVALAGAAVTTRAQETPLDAYFHVWSSDRAQLNVRKQAACAVRKFPADARRVVIEDISMRTILNSMPGLTKPCGDGALFRDNRISMSQPIFELALAEALIKRLPSATSLAGVATAPALKRESIPADTSNLPVRIRENLQIDGALLALDAATECAVRRDPEAAAWLARSQPGSNAERASIQQIIGGIRACDRRATIASPFVLRGLAAYNLYRLMDAAHLLGGAEGHDHA
jgi:hypothetical protein